MDKEQLPFLSATELASLIKSRQVSPVEAAEAYLERIPQVDGKLNSYITVTADRAMADARLAERDARETRLAAVEMPDRAEAEIAEAVAMLIEEHRSADETYLQGLRAVLQQPEFATTDRMLDAVEVLEVYRLQRLLDDAYDIEIGSTRVLIGSEHGDETMQGWSMVISSYGVQENLGTVAVLGPTRMHYDRTIPRVRYVAALMSDIVGEISA